MDGSSQKLILRKKPVRLKEWMAVNYCSLEINEWTNASGVLKKYIVLTKIYCPYTLNFKEVWVQMALILKRPKSKEP